MHAPGRGGVRPRQLRRLRRDLDFPVRAGVLTCPQIAGPPFKSRTLAGQAFASSGGEHS